MNWPKYFLLWIPVFPAVMVFNQAFYGFNFQGYALAAAFPKVLIFTGIICFVIYFLKSGTESPPDTMKMAERQPLNQKETIQLVEEPTSVSKPKMNLRLTAEEEQLIEKNLKFYEDLELGTQKPATEAQRHFVDVLNMKAEPRTKHEKAFLKYLQIRDRS